MSLAPRVVFHTRSRTDMAFSTLEPLFGFKRLDRYSRGDDITLAVPLPDKKEVVGADGGSGLELSIISERDAFEALEDDWNALFERAAKSHHVFQSFNWCWHWSNHFLSTTRGENPGTELRIVTGRRAGRLTMVWPLVICREGMLRSLTWLGNPVSQYGDVLVEPDFHLGHDLETAWAFVTRSIPADIVRMGKVRSDAYVADLLKRAGATITHEDVAPFLDLSGAKSFEDYEQRYSAKARRNRRRSRRRLSEHGSLASTLYSGGVNARSFAKDGIQLKQEWLETRGLQSSALNDQRVLNFFGDVADGKGRPVGCRVSRLSLDTATAAMSICFSCKGRVVAHVMAYDLDLQRFGVGGVLMEEDVRQMICDNVKVFDLMAPAARYKSEWADGVATVRDWAKPFTTLGFLWVHVYLRFLRERLKRLFAATPVAWRRCVKKSHTGVWRLLKTTSVARQAGSN